MCGFAGVFHPSTHRATDEVGTVAATMAETIRHRGPDDAGVWSDADVGVALGFRRLAVIDLSPAGHQPMMSHDGGLVLVFNGEIYNHLELRAELATTGADVAWRGHSDTETLLASFAAWGVVPALRRAAGMFALALWDRRERRLWLARDRFGEKPLYYGWCGGVFVFGSELKALRRHPRFDNPIDRNALALFMQYRAVPAPYSIYEGVFKLEPGCVLSIDASAAVQRPSGDWFAPVRRHGIVLDRYWSLADIAASGEATPIGSEGDAAQQLEAALVTAVRQQSVADVPLGAFLSGGVDSSTIVGLMQRHAAGRVRTFTIGFDDPTFDEAPFARAVARHLGTDHTELYVRPEEARDVIPGLPNVYSEPFADSSQIPTYLVSRMARQHVTVALSGDGGDELFGGYNRHVFGARIHGRLQHVPPLLQRGAAALVHRVPSAAWDQVGLMLPRRHRVARLGDKAHKLADRLDAADEIELYRRMATTGWRMEPVVQGAHPRRTLLDVVDVTGAVARPEHRMMLADGMTYLPDDVLHKVDRAAMGVSLETRAPFLDHRVAEIAWRIPLSMKIRDGQGKAVLRQILHRLVPTALLDRPKAGFALPVGAWLRGPLRDWAEDLLDQRHMRADGFLQPDLVRRRWSQHLDGRRSWDDELWCVLMFQAWLRSSR